MWSKVQAVLLAAVLAAGTGVFAQAAQKEKNPGGYQPEAGSQHPVTRAAQQAEEDRISREVRHQLLMLPYYSVFDDLGYKVEGNTVTLTGAVTEPWTKSDAAAAVKKVEGVEKVNDQVQVLAPSSMDDQIRRAEFRTIYGTPQLQKYSWYAVQGIHIIVQNGHVTLVGTVDSQADKDIAGLRANSVPDVFSVNNDLQVAGNGHTQQAKK
ncbi:MAG: BON domain-containing protein [Acidobacteria bacterium]|nr:BON domain-containing protein [Acidobacteriota bacterium]